MKSNMYQQDQCEPSLRVLQVIRRYSDFDALNSSLMVSAVCVCVSSLTLH